MEQNEKLQKIIKLGASISSIHVLDKLLDFLTKGMVEIMEAERGTLYILDKEKDELYARVSLEMDCKFLRLKIGQGIVGHVVENGKIVNITDAYSDSRFDNSFDKLSGFHTRSILCIPLRNMTNDVIGAVQVINKKDGIFDDDDIAILSMLSNLSATSIENTSLVQSLKATHNELERMVSEITRLYEMEKLISNTIDLESVFQIVLSESRKASIADIGVLSLLDDTRDNFVSTSVSGQAVKTIWKKNTPVGKGIIVKATEERESFYLNDIDNSADIQPVFFYSAEYEIKNILCLPLILNDSVVGVFELINKCDGKLPFTDIDLNLSSIMASQAVKAIERSRIISEVVTDGKLSAVGAMASGVIHDMRSPMNIIKSLLQFLREDSTTNEEKENFFNLIDNEINRFCRMTEDVMDFASGETLIINCEQITTESFLERISAILRNDPNFENIEYKTEIISVPEIYVDQDRMERVVLNLAFNARDAMHQGGKLGIRILRKEGGKEVIIEVEDSGHGIPAEIADKIFDPFCTHGKKGGTGLGLSLAKKIVDDHNGSIVVKSAQNRGTRFSITLPAR